MARSSSHVLFSYPAAQGPWQDRLAQQGPLQQPDDAEGEGVGHQNPDDAAAEHRPLP